MNAVTVGKWSGQSLAARSVSAPHKLTNTVWLHTTLVKVEVMTHPNEDLLHEYDQAWLDGDLDKVRGMFTDDVLVEIPGRNQLSGTYRGKDELFGRYLAKVGELTELFQITESKAVLAKDDIGVAIVGEKIARGGKTIEIDRLFVYGFRDGKISSITQYEDDQYQIDEFFS